MERLTGNTPHAMFRGSARSLAGASGSRVGHAQLQSLISLSNRPSYLKSRLLKIAQATIKSAAA